MKFLDNMSVYIQTMTTKLGTFSIEKKNVKFHIFGLEKIFALTNPHL